MSYILDALRRADSERDRGAVPTLFGQPLPRVSVDAGSSIGQGRWLWAAIAVLVLALVGMVVWRLTAPAAPAAQAVASAAPSLAPADAVQAPITADHPTVRPLADAAAPLPRRLEATPPPRIAEPARAARNVARSEARTTDKASISANAANAAKAATAAKEASAAGGADARIYARNELPSEVQRELPTLAIGGASYSESAANRMLIINGQVFHEGDKLAPELVLEQIKLKAAVLRYKGYRYSVSY